MAIPLLSDDLNIISALEDYPNDDTGLTSAQLKAKFDEAVNIIKDYLNDNTPDLATLDDLSSVLAGTIPDSSITEAKLAFSVATQAELDNLAGTGRTTETVKANKDAIDNHKVSSDHDSRYYTKTELNNGQLDNRYYTETELNNGQLDTRYYTETESDNKYVAKVDSALKLNSGSFTETTSISSGSDYTKNVALGGSYKLAFVRFVENDNTSHSGGFVIANTNQNSASSIGVNTPADTYQGEGVSRLRTVHSNLTDNSFLSYNEGFAGTNDISLIDCYINGTNLTFKWNNRRGLSSSLNVAVYWDVIA